MVIWKEKYLWSNQEDLINDKKDACESWIGIFIV